MEVCKKSQREAAAGAAVVAGVVDFVRITSGFCLTLLNAGTP